MVMMMMVMMLTCMWLQEELQQWKSQSVCPPRLVIVIVIIIVVLNEWLRRHYIQRSKLSPKIAFMNFFLLASVILWKPFFPPPFFPNLETSKSFLSFFLGDFFSTLKHVTIWWDLINYPKSSQYLILHSTSPSNLNSTRVAANYLISNLSLNTRCLLNFGFKSVSNFHMIQLSWVSWGTKLVSKFLSLSFVILRGLPFKSLQT